MMILRDRDFCAELELATTVRCPAPRERGRSIVRSAILIFLAILAFATTPARAQGTWLDTRLIEATCSDKTTPAANTDRLAKRRLRKEERSRRQSDLGFR